LLRVFDKLDGLEQVHHRLAVDRYHEQRAYRLEASDDSLIDALVQLLHHSNLLEALSERELYLIEVHQHLDQAVELRGHLVVEDQLHFVQVERELLLELELLAELGLQLAEVDLVVLGEEDRRDRAKAGGYRFAQVKLLESDARVGVLLPAALLEGELVEFFQD